LDHDKLEQYSSVLYDLKYKILKTGPEMDFDRIKIYENRFQKNYLTSLRIFFLTQDDIKERPELASKLYMHFDQEISNNNELMVVEYMLEMIGNE